MFRENSVEVLSKAKDFGADHHSSAPLTSHDPGVSFPGLTIRSVDKRSGQEGLPGISLINQRSVVVMGRFHRIVLKTVV